jgi:hypothetical protein
LIIARVRVTELTAAQGELLSPIRKDWVPLCLSTEPADRLVAEEALARAYESAGLRPPSVMVRLDSPLAGRPEAARLVVQRHRRVLGVDDQDWRTVDELFGRNGAGGGSAFDCGESVFPQIREAVQGDVDRHLRARGALAVWTEVMGFMRDPGVSSGIWC